MSEGARNPRTDDPFPDPEEYNSYLDGLRDEDIKHIDDMLEQMRIADQHADDAALRVLECADHTLTEISDYLKRS